VVGDTIDQDALTGSHGLTIDGLLRVTFLGTLAQSDVLD
jgi:hypothetical protein